MHIRENNGGASAHPLQGYDVQISPERRIRIENRLCRETSGHLDHLALCPEAVDHCGIKADSVLPQDPEISCGLVLPRYANRALGFDRFRLCSYRPEVLQDSLRAVCSMANGLSEAANEENAADGAVSRSARRLWEGSAWI